MARFTFKLPDIGEGIAEAEIVAWHVKIGDRVEEDPGLADLMPDKATVEMESPVAGVVVELAGEVGDQVSIGAALVVIETDAVEGEAEAAEQIASETPGAAEAGVPAASEPVETAAAPSPQGGEGRGEGPPQAEAPVETTPVAAAPKTETAAPAAAPLPTGEREKVLASPAVRDRARALGVDLAHVKAAEGDRIRHADLDAFLRYGSGQGYHAPHASNARPDEPIKVIGMRRRIASSAVTSISST